MATRAPAGLSAGGRKLWREVTTAHTLDEIQLVQLTEACRAKDRLDKLDELLRGDVDVWAEIVSDDEHVRCQIQVAPALQRANDTANLLKQLLAALRLPDPESGKRPQFRGPRGAQKPTVPGGAAPGKVSALDRARERAARKSG